MTLWLQLLICLAIIGYAGSSLLLDRIVRE